MGRRWMIAITAPLLVACGSAGTHATSNTLSTVVSTAAQTTPPPPSLSPSTTVAKPSPTVAKPPHFDTPDAAMRYLAAAWNADNLVELKHVTNPAARDELNAMHSEAVDLTLTACTPRPGLGDYNCTFSHHFPKGYSKKGIGEADFLVGPAETPGWYMTVFVGCG